MEIDQLTELSEQRQQAMFNETLATRPIAISMNRLTVQMQVYHERQGNRPTVIGSNYDTPLENQLQPYIRDFMAGPDWTQLDYGWLPKGSAGLVIIENRAGIGLQRVPTAEQAKQIASQNLYLGTSQRREWIIRPKRFFFGELNDIEGLWIAAEEIPVPVVVSILAR